jgi:hypothetical protein
MASALLMSCKKENVTKAEPSSTLIGSRWSLVNDATSENASRTTPASSSN